MEELKSRIAVFGSGLGDAETLNKTWTRLKDFRSWKKTQNASELPRMQRLGGHSLNLLSPPPPLQCTHTQDEPIRTKRSRFKATTLPPTSTASKSSAMLLRFV